MWKLLAEGGFIDGSTTLISGHLVTYNSPAKAYAVVQFNLLRNSMGGFNFEAYVWPIQSLRHVNHNVFEDGAVKLALDAVVVLFAAVNVVDALSYGFPGVFAILLDRLRVWQLSVMCFKWFSSYEIPATAYARSRD
jgi:hypothetical protein